MRERYLYNMPTVKCHEWHTRIVGAGESRMPTDERRKMQNAFVYHIKLFCITKALWLQITPPSTETPSFHLLQR
jgi:hypothetical protein